MPKTSRMRVMAAGLVLIGAALLATLPALAQGPRWPTPTPPPTSAEALAGDYGNRLVDEFAAILDASVDRACLAARGIAAPGRDRAREWLTRYGQRMIDGFAESFDLQAARAAFAAAAGTEALTEFDALAQHPVVREANAIGLPLRHATLAESIVENLDLHLLLERVRLARRVSPLAAANMALLDFREERDDVASNALDAFNARHEHVAELARFIELSEHWLTAVQAAARPDFVSHRAFDGIIPELRENCIGQR